MKSQRRTAGARISPERAEVPALPVWKAFIVQFSRETRARRGPLAGRIEHMSSGRRSPFESAEQLLAALRKMLDELGDADV